MHCGVDLRRAEPDPTRNLALAALRHFFDALVTRHAVALNPFSSVRGKKHSVVDGKTPELSPGMRSASGLVTASGNPSPSGGSM